MAQAVVRFGVRLEVRFLQPTGQFDQEQMFRSRQVYDKNSLLPIWKKLWRKQLEAVRDWRLPI